MKSIIQLKNISKQFQMEKVITNFSYSFEKSGLYLLLGDSGSGKSTLLNLISGNLEFDKGSIVINGVEYKNQVNSADIRDFVAYISQDSKLIEYLTVYDNLKLCCDDDSRIKESAANFGVERLFDKYPNELSGGEKQRIIILQFILLDKKIFLLDEVSSSLDYQNKIKTFELLQKLSDDNLIIFATHDVEAKKYAKEIVTVNESKEIKEDDELVCIGIHSVKKPKLYKYIKKQGKYKKNILSKTILSLIFIVSLLIVFMCSDIQGKMFRTALNSYKINYLTVRIPMDYDKQKLIDKYNIVDMVYNYRMNLPYYEFTDNPQVHIDYETQIFSLPIDKNNFPFSDSLLYGTYFTGKNQVILGIDKAKQLSLHPETLIGKNIDIKFPDKTDSLEIVGIFDYFNEDVNGYTNGGGITIGELDNNNYFVNGEYLEKYIDDDVLSNYETKYGLTEYFLFFKKTKDLIKFYNDFNKENLKLKDGKLMVLPLGGNFVEQKSTLESISIYLYPTIVISIIVVIAFYLQYKLIELKYTEYNLGIYESLGFSPKKIKRATLWYEILDIVKIFLITLTIAIVGSLIFNFLNERYRLIDFIYFTFNVDFILAFFILVLVLSTIITYIAFRHLKIDGWLNMSYRSRDIL